MATANTKSTIVTNADTLNGAKKNGLHLTGGRVRHARATVEVAAADDNASVYRFFRVHSSWSVLQLLVWNDAIASGSQFDIGLHDIAENGGAAIDDDCWATQVSMTSARAVPLDATFEALNVDKIEKKVWEVAGLSADPNKMCDITMTADTVGTAAGTISMLMYYCAND